MLVNPLSLRLGRLILATLLCMVGTGLASCTQAARINAGTTNDQTPAHRYVRQIHDQVTRQWIRPVSTTCNLSARVRVELEPNGQIHNATLVASSGNEAFDASVLNAVNNASPLPVPTDPELFSSFRVINLPFSLKDKCS